MTLQQTFGVPSASHPVGRGCTLRAAIPPAPAATTDALTDVQARLLRDLSAGGRLRSRPDAECWRLEWIGDDLRAGLTVVRTSDVKALVGRGLAARAVGRDGDVVIGVTEAGQRAVVDAIYARAAARTGGGL